jgi:hypothetical protein
MLEEYRVTVFARQLGTSQPVSERRLENLWRRVLAAAAQAPDGRMV